MKNLIVFALLIGFVFTTSSCSKKKCSATQTTKDTAGNITTTQLTWETYSASCNGSAYEAGGYVPGGYVDYGTGTNTNTGTVTVFDPNAYQPNGDLIKVHAVVCNDPYDHPDYGKLTDFARRSAHKDDYTVVADASPRNSEADDDGVYGVNKNNMGIWVYSDIYGYILTGVSKNKVESYSIGSGVTVTLTQDPTMPFAIFCDAQNVRYHQTMRSITRNDACYAYIYQ